MGYVILKRDKWFYPALIQKFNHCDKNYLIIGRDIEKNGEFCPDLFPCNSRKKAVKKVKDITDGIKYFRMPYLSTLGFKISPLLS